METLSVNCNCCGLAEECTQDYISQVKAKFDGKWLCGLCSEAVRDELNRNRIQLGVEEAVRAHMSFCGQFNNSNPAGGVANGMRQILRRRSGDLSSPSSSKKYDRSASAKVFY